MPSADSLPPFIAIVVYDLFTSHLMSTLTLLIDMGGLMTHLIRLKMIETRNKGGAFVSFFRSRNRK